MGYLKSDKILPWKVHLFNTLKKLPPVWIDIILKEGSA